MPEFRSASPYAYSVERRRPGQDPTKVPEKYIETSKFSEAQYVVTKKANLFCLQIDSFFIWDYDNECNAVFKNGESILRIVKNDKNSANAKAFSVEHIRELAPISIKADPSVSLDSSKYQIDGSLIKINEKAKSDKIDFVVLNNRRYADYELYFDEEMHPVIDLGEEISGDIEIVGFDFSVSEDDYLSFSFTEISPTEFSMNYAERSIECPNSLNEYCVVPIVYDLSGRRRSYSANISIHKISFSYNDFRTKVDMIKQSEELKKELRTIEDRNSDCPPALLYYENDEYKQKKDSLNSILNDISNMTEHGYQLEIGKAYAYSCNRGKTLIVRNGIDDSANGVKWTENRVEIHHGLDGIVKLVLDDSYAHKVSYVAKMIDRDTIEIDFGKNVMSEYTLSLFRVS